MEPVIGIERCELNGIKSWIKSDVCKMGTRMKPGIEPGMRTRRTMVPGIRAHGRYNLL